MIAETSRMAYDAIKHKIGKRQEAVYKIIERRGVATSEDIADEMGLPMHAVSGRFTELLKLGLIGVEGTGKNRNGNTVRLYSVRGLHDQKVAEMANDCEG